MNRSILLLLVYTGTILLYAMLPVCLLFPVEQWRGLFVQVSFAIILLGFLIRTFSPGLAKKKPRGIGYYLYGGGYWGKPGPDFYGNGVDWCTFLYLAHWYVIMPLCLYAGEWLFHRADPAVRWHGGMLVFLFLYNIAAPLYGILWRSCFQPYTATDELSYLRIPPLFYDLFFQWLCVAAALGGVLRSVF